jgi:CRP/FNR family transcriptional regulator, cyclic AMP receptor protein
LGIAKKSMMHAIHREHAFSDMFVAYLLERNVRYEEDLVNQLFNSSEKRLARILLLLAHFGKEGVPEVVIPKIQPGDAGGDDRYDTLPSQLLYEPVPEVRLC